MLTAVKILRFLWPFIKELVLGDKTLKEAFKHHFWRVALIALIMLSFALNVVFIPRLFTLSYEHVELQRRYSELMRQRFPNAEIPGLPDPEPAEVVSPPEPAVAAQPAASAPVTAKTDPAIEEYRRTKEMYDRMRAQERRHN